MLPSGSISCCDRDKSDRTQAWLTLCTMRTFIACFCEVILLLEHSVSTIPRSHRRQFEMCLSLLQVFRRALALYNCVACSSVVPFVGHPRIVDSGNFYYIANNWVVPPFLICMSSIHCHFCLLIKTSTGVCSSSNTFSLEYSDDAAEAMIQGNLEQISV